MHKNQLACFECWLHSIVYADQTPPTFLPVGLYYKTYGMDEQHHKSLNPHVKGDKLSASSRSALQSEICPCDHLDDLHVNSRVNVVSLH
jgi:hypothetical protein